MFDPATMSFVQNTSIGALGLFFMYLLFTQSIKAYTHSLKEITDSLKENTILTAKIYQRVCKK